MKRFLSVILLFSLILGTLIGCQASDEPSPESSSGSSSDVSSETVGGGSPITVDGEFREVTEEMITMETEDMKLIINVRGGVRITSIYDKTLNHEYLTSSISLFKYTVYTNLSAQNSSAWQSEGDRLSKSGLTVTKAEINAAGNSLKLSAVTDGGDFIYDAALVFTDSMSFDIRLAVTSQRDDEVFVRLSLPSITMLNMKQEDATVMIPQEAGWVAPYDGKSSMGHEKLDSVSGMPTSVNAMELVTVYSESLGGGILFSDTEGYIGGENSEIQFILNGYEISGLWGLSLKKGETRSTPALTAGLFRGRDWRYGVDYYMSRRDSSLLSTDIPEWWLECAGVYSTHPGTGGPFTFWYGTGRLPTFISNFNDLDQVLAEAETYGLNTIILQDWYDCPDRSDPSIPESWWNDSSLDPYSWNKGDYEPREDMGGAEAFKNGIQKVHDAGGRVIVYVEPFIVLYYSALAKTEAKDWYALDAYGNLWEPYEYNYSMVPNNVEWQDKLTEICETLVEEYEVDGIYLDSFGWQFGHVNSIASDPATVYDPEDYNTGWVTLMKKVREAVKAINSDTIVLGESGCGPMLYVLDGGWTSDFAWGMTTTEESLTASPLRYSRASLGVFTNGETVHHLNQVFAAGYSLTISDPWKPYDSYIKTLVEIRQKYSDALIHGKQESQPDTNNENVVTYFFRGSENEVITCANLSDRRQEAVISMGSVYAGVRFINAVDNAEYTADGQGNITVQVRTEKAVVLVRQK